MTLQVRAVAQKCRDGISTNTCEYFATFSKKGDICGLLTSPLLPWGNIIKSFKPSFKCPLPTVSWSVFPGSGGVHVPLYVFWGRKQIFNGEPWLYLYLKPKGKSGGSRGRRGPISLTCVAGLPAILLSGVAEHRRGGRWAGNESLVTWRTNHLPPSQVTVRHCQGNTRLTSERSHDKKNWLTFCTSKQWCFHFTWRHSNASIT